MAEQWLKDHPDDVSVASTYGEMLYQLTRYDEALAVFHDMIEHFPERRWGTYNQLGHLYRYRGDFEKAMRWYRKAIEEDSTEATSFIFLGAIQARQGLLTDAEATHRTATQCKNGCIDEAYHNLGLVLRGQGRYDEAEECFGKAIEIDPEYEAAIEALDDIITVRKLIGENG